ncbi:hypothetical protein CH267_12910 [Rhodococcus sp. 06-621-2]|nr:acyl-CoA dehydrogenase family protein [Rhodococcus sp. 06-621-2]OZC55474.1 hypothetical protein CH267_12910 [Rhodococcus sp. 06-621-2]
MSSGALRGVETFEPVRLGPVDFDDLFDAIALDSVDADRAESVPWAAVRSLLDAGFGTVRLPVEVGGRGLTNTEFLSLVIALGAANPSVAHLFLNHFLALSKIMRRRPKFHQRWIDLAVDGALFSECAIEADPNVTAGGGITLTTLAEVGPGEYELSGTKAYATGSTVADVLFVSAMLKSVETQSTTKVTVAVRRAAQGVEVVDDWDGFGQRLSGSGTVRFDRVRISDTDIVFTAPDSEPYLAASPQLFMTAIVAGVTRAIRDDGATILRNRSRNFYHGTAPTPSDDPTLHVVMGQLVTDAFTAEAIALKAAESLDAVDSADSAGARSEMRLEATVQCSMAKVAVDEVAQRAASTLFDLAGASATSKGIALDRHWRNIRTLASHNPDVYKRRVVGEWFLLGTPPPRGGFF